MNTAKKRILSLTLTICLALSMMLTLSACGKKNLEEYFNTDTMQKLVTSSIEQYESQGMELKMYAEGDELHYDLTLTTIETTDDDRSMYAEALEAGLAETAQTFVDAAKECVVRFQQNRPGIVTLNLTPLAWADALPNSFLPLRTDPVRKEAAPVRLASSKRAAVGSPLLSFSPDTPPPDRRL